MSAQQDNTSEDFLHALAEADVLEIFRRLPHADQERFTHWVTQTRDAESHWRRVNALVLALRTGPLQVSSSPRPIDDPATRG